MNIVELIKEAISDFPDIKKVHVDFLENVVDTFGVSSMGDQNIRYDILGNETRRHQMMFYAMFSSVNDFERISNSGILLQLQYYLEHYPDEQKITASDGIREFEGYLKNIRCSNGQVFTIPDGTMMGAVQYNLQISAEYYVERI